MEFIKNLLYDISDSVIKLIVVGAMVFVIAFKLNTAMPDIDVFGYANQGEVMGESEQKVDDANVISIDLTDSSINKNTANAQGQNTSNPDSATDDNTKKEAENQKQMTAQDPQQKPDATKTNTQANADAPADEQKKNDAQTKPKTQEEIKAEEEAKKKIEAERVTKKIVIESGYTSQKIASVLVNDKVIKDAGAFLDVVAELGYTSKLRSGTYYLSSDMTYEEIANKLVGR